MITFKQYLTEARMAPLYHGTYLENLRNIVLKEQGLRPKTFHEGEDLLKHNKGVINGVSASRNFTFASSYRQTEMVGVLELDQNSLNKVYEIKPINYWRRLTGGARYPEIVGGQRKSTRRTEYEEFIITNKPIPIKYITKLYVPHRAVNQPIITEIRQKFGSDFIRTY